MGAKCFCGCGRRISLRHLGRRSYNNRGHAVVKALAWFRGELDETGTTPDPGLQQWLDEGDMVVDLLASAAHGELQRPNVIAMAQWEKDGRKARREAERRQWGAGEPFADLIEPDPALAAVAARRFRDVDYKKADS